MKNQEVKFIAPTELKVSNNYEKIYGKNEVIDPLLYETIKNDGIKEPLVITAGNTIVSGVLRWKIAMELSQSPQFGRKFQLIPVVITENEDTDVEIIIHNQGRTKTYSQKLREFKLLKDEFLSGRGYRTDMSVAKTKSKEKLEDVLGESYSTLYRLSYIDTNIEQACKNETKLVKKKWENLDTHKMSVTGLYNWVKKQIEVNKSTDKPKTYKKGNMILLNKSCEDLSDLSNASVNCVICSPPYYDMRNYDNGISEIGKEKDLDDYVKNICQLLNYTKSKLTSNGSIIVNLGDVFKSGDLKLIPHRIALGMASLGWKINTEVIWSKNNPPFSLNGNRPNPSHEFIFQFYQGTKPYYDVTWLKEPNQEIREICYGDKEKNKETNLRSVWTFDENTAILKTNVNNLSPVKRVLAKQQIKLTHPAMMNELVAAILVKSFTKEGELVVDIFNGTNTTGIRCQELGRNFYGYEVNPEYFQQSIIRTENVVLPEKKTTRKPRTQKIAA